MLCDWCNQDSASFKCGVFECETIYCNQTCADVAWNSHNSSKTHSFQASVVSLLNDYKDNERTIQALRMLETRYLTDKDWNLRIVFHHCDEWPRERQQTAKANSNRIMICDDIQTAQFQKESVSFPLPRGLKFRVTHYTAVILHEFGHVLHKNGYLDNLVIETGFVPDKDNDERVADWWVHQFLAKKE